MKMRLLSLVIAASLIGCGSNDTSTIPSPEPPPSPQQLQKANQEWFQDAKFGMFIHWGVYSVLADGEWVMHRKEMTVDEYEKLPPQFNPVDYDPAEWVALAKEAGMKYITITSKHHDGFAMWDSEVSDYNIVDATPYGKDVLKMLADECEKQGIKLFFYHSHLDWRHPDYYPRGRTGQHSGRPDSGDFDKYLDYMDEQIRELASGRYGELGGFWFDGWWDQRVQEEGADPKATHIDWRLEKTYQLIHELQPQALIGNNHHVAPFEGENFQMFEKDLPGHNTTGFSGDSQIGQLPLETCETINRAWGFNKNDQNFKSTEDLIHYLVKAAGYNSNFLLNVGPTPLGTIQPEFVERLKAIGDWLKENGESVYGTRGGPVPPQDWGVSTQKDGTVYVHVMDPEAPEEITLPGTSQLKIKEASLFPSGGVIPFSQDADLVLTLPRSARRS